MLGSILSRQLKPSKVHFIQMETFAFIFQSKIHAARSLSEIAIDLTETGTLKTSKLANMGSKGKIISGSSGSLLSSGELGPTSPHPSSGLRQTRFHCSTMFGPTRSRVKFMALECGQTMVNLLVEIDLVQEMAPVIQIDV